MPQQMQRIIFILASLAPISAINTFAQAATSKEMQAEGTGADRQLSVLPISAKERIDLVMIDRPHHRHSCHVQTLTDDELICSRAFGGSQTYLGQQILALIRPGDNGLKLRLVSALNLGAGAAIWGTVVLAAACPACAAATGAAALLLLSAAGAILMGDDQPDRLIYLAAGKQLTGKLQSIQR